MSDPTDLDGLMDPADIDETTAPRGKPGVSSVELDGEAVLLDEESGAVHALNPTASLVWTFLNGSLTIAELVDDFGSAFEGADPATIRADVLEVARRFGELGLLDGVRPLTTTPAPAHDHPEHGHPEHGHPEHGHPEHEHEAHAGHDHGDVGAAPEPGAGLEPGDETAGPRE